MPPATITGLLLSAAALGTERRVPAREISPTTYPTHGGGRGPAATGVLWRRQGWRREEGVLAAEIWSPLPDTSRVAAGEGIGFFLDDLGTIKFQETTRLVCLFLQNSMAGEPFRG